MVTQVVRVDLRDRLEHLSAVLAQQIGVHGCVVLPLAMTIYQDMLSRCELTMRKLAKFARQMEHRWYKDMCESYGTDLVAGSGASEGYAPMPQGDCFRLLSE